MYHYRIQLVDHNGKNISTAGGVCYVAAAGDAQKVALKDSTGASASNPSALTNGKIEFFTAETVPSVDLYGIAPSGHAFIAKGIVPSGPNEIRVDTSRATTTLVIPFSIADTTANTETDTGFDVPTRGAVLPHMVGVDVLTADSGMTIDVGTLSSDSGDADGYIDGISLTTVASVKASLTNGSVTLGALLKVQDSANAGDAVPEANTSMSGKSITYTLSSSTDTGEGFIKLPMQLNVAYLG